MSYKEQFKIAWRCVRILQQHKSITMCDLPMFCSMLSIANECYLKKQRVRAIRSRRLCVLSALRRNRVSIERRKEKNPQEIEKNSLQDYQTL